MTHTFSYKVPAKTLLFGEYGALLGLPVWVATGLGHHFEVAFTVGPDASAEPGVLVESSFFSGGSLWLPAPLESNINPDGGFFRQLLKPWHFELSTRFVQITVKTSYPPHFGFGSSSALTVAVSRGLWHIFKPHEELTLEKLHRLWQNMGATGSGYDVAAQFCGSVAIDNCGEPPLVFWEFRGGPSWVCNPLATTRWPHHLGFLLDTQLYAPTAAILKALSPLEKKAFGERHGDLATSILNHVAQGTLTTQVVANHMEASLTVAREQGIVPQEWDPLLDTLHRHHTPVKTTGAGHGDALWVLGNPREVLPLLNLPPERCLCELVL